MTSPGVGSGALLGLRRMDIRPTPGAEPLRISKSPTMRMFTWRVLEDSNLPPPVARDAGTHSDPRSNVRPVATRARRVAKDVFTVSHIRESPPNVKDEPRRDLARLVRQHEA